MGRLLGLFKTVLGRDKKRSGSGASRPVRHIMPLLLGAVAGNFEGFLNNDDQVGLLDKAGDASYGAAIALGLQFGDGAFGSSETHGIKAQEVHGRNGGINLITGILCDFATSLNGEGARAANEGEESSGSENKADFFHLSVPSFWEAHAPLRAKR